MSDAPTYSITELAALAGVNPRTVRYYVQLGLIPPPPGRGLGGRYGQEHLDRLLRVRALQRQGVSLDQVASLAPDQDVDPVLAERPASASTPVPVRRQVVTRVEVGPGVWLEFAAGRALPVGPRLDRIIRDLRQSLNLESEPASGIVGCGMNPNRPKEDTRNEP